MRQQRWSPSGNLWAPMSTMHLIERFRIPHFMALTLRDTAYHTYREYRTWPEDLRYELIDSAAYLMAPAPARVHQEVVGDMYRQTANAPHGKPCRPFIAPFDVRLPRGTEPDDQVDTVVQPDLLVVCDPSKLGRVNTP